MNILKESEGRGVDRRGVLDSVVRARLGRYRACASL